MMTEMITVVMSLAIGLLSVNTASAAQNQMATNDNLIEIIMAKYGSDERGRCDAKKIVSEACHKKQSCELPVMRELCESKMGPQDLTVIYACRDKGHTVVAKDGQIVKLDCPN